MFFCQMRLQLFFFVFFFFKQKTAYDMLRSLVGSEMCIIERKAGVSAVRRLEVALRAGGMPKNEAMRLISEMKSSLRAGGASGDPGAGGGSAEAKKAAKQAANTAASLTNILENCNG